MKPHINWINGFKVMAKIQVFYWPPKRLEPMKGWLPDDLEVLPELQVVSISELSMGLLNEIVGILMNRTKIKFYLN